MKRAKEIADRELLGVAGERAWSWGELAELTHATQVENFGFCTCEDGPAVFIDCPEADLPIPYTVTDKGIAAS